MLEDRRILANWSGDIPNGTIWTSNEVQHVVGDARVPAGAALTIEPGTIVKFNSFSGVDLLVDGSLVADGTPAQPIIFTTDRDDSAGGDTNNNGAETLSNGQWETITFGPTSTANVMDQVEVRYGGGNSAGMVVVNSAPLTLSNSVIRNSRNAGVRITTSNPILTGNTFQNNNGAALSMDLTSNPAISGVMLATNGFNGLSVDSGTLSGSRFWDDPDIVYGLAQDVTVGAGATLTIAPGQVVKFPSFAGVDLIVNGTLNADGTPAQPIIFTTDRDDSAGGDTNNNGAETLSNGQWETITFGATSTANVLDHIEVRYGGGNRAGMVEINGAALTLSNSVIRNSRNAGVRITTSNPILTGNTFQNNNGAAVSMDLASNPAISGVMLATNGFNGLSVDSGTLSGARFWDDPDIVYGLAQDVTVGAGATLTVAPGQIVKLPSFAGADLIVNGTLNADGTPARPIIFTTDRDDSAGGDSNNNGAETLSNGQWEAITFGATSTANVMDHVDVRYGGGNRAGTVEVNGAALTLSNSVIRNSRNAGVRITGSNPVLTGNAFRDNSGAALSMDLASNPAISGATLSNNGLNGLSVDSGTLSGARFWDDPDIVYGLAQDVTVGAGATLTIAPGQVVKFPSFAGVDLIVNGTLNADGTPAQPIIFTTDRDDSAGDDTNNNGAETLSNGQWEAITFGATSTANVMDHVEVRYGGGNRAGMVMVEGAPLTLSNSIIRNSRNAGVRITGSNPVLTGNSFQNNSGAAVSMDLASNPAISGVTLTNNGFNGLSVDSGTLTGTRFWDDPDIVYGPAQDVTVDAGATLTVAPGQIVKLPSFAGADLIVNGTLNADGTPARPIIFTTDRDDSAGGDTNNNGAETLSNGQWEAITFGATSTANVMDHVEVRYGGGNRAGMVEVNGAALTLSNSVIRNSRNAGVRITGSNPTPSGYTLQNNMFVRNSLAGIRAEGGSSVTVLNNVLDANGTGMSLAAASGRLLNNTIVFNDTGILAENAAEIVAANNIVAYQTVRGVAATGNGQIDLHFNDVFNPTATQGNFSGVADPQGARGNISRDPRFHGRGRFGDYRLFAGSPAIDAGLSSSAALGITAPTTDANGNPRFDDPGIAPNTGSGDPNFYDLGAFERQAVSEPDADLSIVLNSAPSAAMVGDEVTFAWTVTNLGPNTAEGPWIDRVSILFDDSTARAPLRIIERERTTSLGVGSSYHVEASVRLPGFVPGIYRWVVETDGNEQVFEALLEGNNQVVTEPVSLDMQQLVLGVPLAGQFTTEQNERWYKVDVDEGQSIQVTLTPQTPQGLAELFVGSGYYLDTQLATDPGAQRAPTLDIVTTHDQFYYVLARGSQLGAEAHGYQILAETLGFEVLDVTPDAGGNAGQVTITVTGQAIPDDAMARLITATGQQIAAAAVHQPDTTRLIATFDLSGAAAGLADLIVVADAAQRTLNDVFRIDVGGSPDFFVQITGPQNVRIDRPVEYTVTWGNRGNVDAPAYLVNLSASELVRLTIDPTGDDLSDGYQFLAMARDSAAASLPPGTRESVRFFATTSGFGNFSIDAQYVAIDDPQLAARTIDWEAIRAEAQPDLLTLAQWNDLLNQLVVQAGNNWGRFAERMAAHSLQSLQTPFDPSDSPSAAVSFQTGLLAEIGLAEAALGWLPPPPQVVQAAAEAPGQIRALIVAPYLYQKTGALVSAAPDALTIHELLTDVAKVPPNRIRVLSDAPPIKSVPSVERGSARDYSPQTPNPNTVFGQLEKLSRESRPQDTIFFYFTGHSDFTQFDFGGTNSSRFTAYEDLMKALKSTQAGRIMLVLDSCESGNFINQLNRLKTQGDLNEEQFNKFTIITATDLKDPRQKSVGNLSTGSPFTNYLSEAMRNPVNDLNHDGMVSLNEAFRHLPKDIAPFWHWAQRSSFQGQDAVLCDPAGSAKIKAEKGLVKQAPPGTGRAGVTGRSGAGSDPNDKAGPGFGDAGWVAPDESLSYVIRFENIAPPGVPADFIFPAQQVVVTDPLPAELDLSSFELGSIQFGGTHVAVPSGRKDFQFHVQARHDPNPVEINVGLDAATRTVTWQMRSYDIETGAFPDDPLAGFLPINDATHKGEGFVTFRARPIAGLTNGSRFSNSASIVFDTNAAIVTNTVVNTIDAVPPTSSIGMLPTETTPNFDISWTGNDGMGSGVALFDIYISVDGGSFALWLNDTPELSAQYAGAGGHSYAFYSVATDNVGHVEAPPPQPDAMTTITGPPLTTISGTPGDDAIHVVRAGNELAVYVNIAPVGEPTQRVPLSQGATLTISSGEGADVLTVDSGQQAALGLNRLIYNAGAGNNTLVLANGIARIDSTAPGGTLNTTVQAGAQLSTSRLGQNGLTLADNGRVTLLSDGGTSAITSLTLGNNATLDIGNNAVVIDYTGTSPVASVREKILSGRGGPGFGQSWTGAGITSSAAAQANQTEPESQSVGYAENASLPLGPYTAFRGQAVDNTSILIAYIRTADANLDGLVNDDDVTIVGATYAPGVLQPHWPLGDFDYNGFVEDDDVTLLGVFYEPSANPLVLSPAVLGQGFPGSDFVSIGPTARIDNATLWSAISHAAQWSVNDPTTRFLPWNTLNSGALDLSAEIRGEYDPIANDDLIDLLAESIAAGEGWVQSGDFAVLRRTVPHRSPVADDIWTGWTAKLRGRLR